MTVTEKLVALAAALIDIVTNAPAAITSIQNLRAELDTVS